MHKPSKPAALPLPPAEAAHYQARRNVRGLAPKLDLRSKMAQLQANQSSPSDPQASRQMPWQCASPADAVDLSPSAAQFRGLPSPVYSMPGQSFADQKNYGAQASEIDTRQLGQAIPVSPPYQDPINLHQDPSARVPVQRPDDYAQVPAFSMNGMGKMAAFDYYPSS